MECRMKTRRDGDVCGMDGWMYGWMSWIDGEGRSTKKERMKDEKEKR